MNPRISIIVPVYNVEKELKVCLNSIVPQLNETVDLILVDDGSTDTSGTICDNCKQAKVIHKQNGGLSSARNVGIDIAKGDWLMFIDGDDAIISGTLATLLDLIKVADVDIIQYGYQELPCGHKSKHSAISDTSATTVTDRHEMYHLLYEIGGEAASACTKLIRRFVIGELRFPEGRLHEDEFFTTQLLTLASSIFYIPDWKPYLYLQRSGSIQTSGLNPLRLTSLIEMFHERLQVLESLGYDDLASLTRGRFFSNMLLHYCAACNKGDNLSSHLALSEARILSRQRFKIRGVLGLLKILTRMWIPAFFLYEQLYKILK